VRVELDTLAPIALAKCFFEIGEEVLLTYSGRLLGSSASRSVDDLCDTRFGDDLVTLEWQYRRSVDDHFISDVKHKVADAAHALRQGNLVSQPSHSKCRGCDFRGMCSADRVRDSTRTQ